MKKLAYYTPKILSLLRIRPFIGGLEISDVALRFAYYSGNMWHLTAVPLEPGTLESGKIKDREKFILALKTLRAGLSAGSKRYKISVVVSLSSISIYSQVFSLPIVKGENLDRAVQLNIEMVSPIDTSQAYSGWQAVGEDQGSLRLEILSAFIDRAVVDEIKKALLEADFIPVVMESRALALTRLLREEGAGMGVDVKKSYILISIDGSGVDFLIIRLGQLYFEYFNPWQDIMNEKGQISSEAFETAVIRNLHQVMNFYGQHWTEPISEVILSAAALKDEAKKVVADNFPFIVRELSLKDQEVAPEWFIALGCGLRGRNPRRNDREMSLLGIGPQEEYYHEQFILFASFWRVLMPMALGLLFVAFALTHFFLAETLSGLEAKTVSNSGSSEFQEVQTLQASAVDFNHEIDLFKATKAQQISKANLILKIRAIAALNGATINRIYFQNADIPLILSGEVPANDNLTALKDALGKDPSFKNVNLNLSDIHVDSQGITFSITFTLAT